MNGDRQWVAQDLPVESARDEQLGWENMAGYLYAEGVSDIPKTMPVGDPKQGPTKATKPTTIASMSGKKGQRLADQSFKNWPFSEGVGNLVGF